MPVGLAGASWLWQPATDLPTMITFLRTWGLREVFLGVPWTGPDSATVATATALHTAGFAVSCLGGDPGWAENPHQAEQWATRAVGSGLFTGVHLDIEPWTLSHWHGREADLLTGIVLAVESVRRITDDHDDAGSDGHYLVDVDLPAWLAADHPTGFGRIARAAQHLTILAYRDRAADILTSATAARRLSTAAARGYWIAVDTLPAREPHTTFADDGIQVLRRELSLLARALADDPSCRGIAVHDVLGWQALDAGSGHRG